MGTDTDLSLPKDSSSKTLTPESPEHPFVARFRGVMKELVGASGPTSSRIGKMTLILEAVADEVADELDDWFSNPESPEEHMMVYWEWISHVIAWIGHGDTSKLPEPLQPFARRINGEVEPEGQRAIEAPITMEAALDANAHL